MENSIVHQYILGIADNALILAQRLGELCGHGPTLETDIALTNMALDLLGQTRSYYQYAASLSTEDVSEDTLAFLRTERHYRNVLLVEQPNTHFGFVIARQFLFDGFHLLFLEALSNSEDKTLQAIAQKSIKEVRYHFRFSSDWVKRLGDGTQESKEKIQDAITSLWRYTEELFTPSEIEKQAIELGVGVALEDLKEKYKTSIETVLKEATLEIPETTFFAKGGKQGMHSEHMGYLLSELQYMQRTYPNMTW